MKVKRPTLAGYKHLCIPSSLIGRVVPIFQQKMDGRNSSETDIKVLIPAPTYYSQIQLFPSLGK